MGFTIPFRFCECDAALHSRVSAFTYEPSLLADSTILSFIFPSHIVHCLGCQFELAPLISFHSKDFMSY
jgi:hypothetical protein